MGEVEEKNPNWINSVPEELLEEIFLLLSVKSILTCRSVSKRWRSILESKEFMERRTNPRRILAAEHCNCMREPTLLPESRFQGDEETVYLHCDTEEPLLTCDGLICFPDMDWIGVLNPCTRQFRRFPTCLHPRRKGRFRLGWSCTRPFGSWSMGFGRDKIRGSYKVVKICFSSIREPGDECGILNVATGEWQKLSRPNVGRIGSISASVNGSIYWLRTGSGFKILALDLHKQEFHDVSVPPMWVTYKTRIVNFQDRLAMTQTIQDGPQWILEILTMDAQDEKWSKTYSISLSPSLVSMARPHRYFTPVALSKQGNLVFYDNYKMLFKYYPETHEIRRLSSNTCVLSLYLENLVPILIIYLVVLLCQIIRGFRDHSCYL